MLIEDQTIGQLTNNNNQLNGLIALFWVDPSSRHGAHALLKLQISIVSHLQGWNFPDYHHIIVEWKSKKLFQVILPWANTINNNTDLWMLLLMAQGNASLSSVFQVRPSKRQYVVTTLPIRYRLTLIDTSLVNKLWVWCQPSHQVLQAQYENFPPRQPKTLISRRKVMEGNWCKTLIHLCRVVSRED